MNTASINDTGGSLHAANALGEDDEKKSGNSRMGTEAGPHAHQERNDVDRGK